jgi:hypothetical protein
MHRTHILALSLTAALVLTGAAAVAQDAMRAETIRTFDIAEADQGVGVDDKYFYVVDNTLIAKHDKVTGERVAIWEEAEGGPIVHLDSATVVDGMLYAAHSNYPEWPMTSSVEPRLNPTSAAPARRSGRRRQATTPSANTDSTMACNAKLAG